MAPNLARLLGVVPIVSDIPTTEGGGRPQRERGGESATGKGVAFLHSPPQGRVIQEGNFFLMSGATSLGSISQNTFLFESHRDINPRAYVCKDLMFLGSSLADFSMGFRLFRARSLGRARGSARAMAYDGGGEGEGRKHVKRGSRSEIVSGCVGNK